MLTGVLSDSYIKMKCWELNAPLTLGKRVGRTPVTVKASGNMRNDYTFQTAQPVIHDLATNIIASTPKKNLPVNSDIVEYVSAGLVKTEAPAPAPVPIRTTSMQNPLLQMAEELPVEYDPAPGRLELPSFVMGQMPRFVQAQLRREITRQTMEGGIPRQTAIYGFDVNNPSVPQARRGALQRVPDFPADPLMEQRMQAGRGLAEELRRPLE